MFFRTKSLPFSLLDHPIDQKQKDLFQSWREDDLSSSMMKHREDIIVMTVDRRTQLPIELYRGENSLAARVLGDNWQTDFATSFGAGEIMKAYEESRFGEPTFQFVTHEGQRDDRKFDISYERLVLPLKVGGGLQQFVTLSTLISFEMQPIVARSPEATSPSHKTDSQILLGREERRNRPVSLHTLQSLVGDNVHFA